MAGSPGEEVSPQDPPPGKRAVREQPNHSADPPNRKTPRARAVPSQNASTQEIDKRLRDCEVQLARDLTPSMVAPFMDGPRLYEVLAAIFRAKSPNRSRDLPVWKQVWKEMDKSFKECRQHQVTHKLPALFFSPDKVLCMDYLPVAKHVRAELRRLFPTPFYFPPNGVIPRGNYLEVNLTTSEQFQTALDLIHFLQEPTLMCGFPEWTVLKYLLRTPTWLRKFLVAFLRMRNELWDLKERAVQAAPLTYTEKADLTEVVLALLRLEGLRRDGTCSRMFEWVSRRTSGPGRNVDPWSFCPP